MTFTRTRKLYLVVAVLALIGVAALIARLVLDANAVESDYLPQTDASGVTVLQHVQEYSFAFMALDLTFVVTFIVGGALALFAHQQSRYAH